ncbi:MAG: hypothetical protein MI861_09615, partial [Pirellulales bacterium]|nr:hypothetical protein [Pirellulales bacterium]
MSHDPDLPEDEFPGLPLPDTNHDEAMRELGRQLAIDALLREGFAETEESEAVSNVQPPSPAAGDQNRSTSKVILGIIAALAAGILFTVVWPDGANDTEIVDGQVGPAVDPPPTSSEIHLTGWRISSSP